MLLLPIRPPICPYAAHWPQYLSCGSDWSEPCDRSVRMCEMPCAKPPICANSKAKIRSSLVNSERYMPGTLTKRRRGVNELIQTVASIEYDKPYSRDKFGNVRHWLQPRFALNVRLAHVSLRRNKPDTGVLSRTIASRKREPCSLLGLTPQICPEKYNHAVVSAIAATRGRSHPRGAPARCSDGYSLSSLSVEVNVQVRVMVRISTSLVMLGGSGE